MQIKIELTHKQVNWTARITETQVILDGYVNGHLVSQTAENHKYPIFEIAAELLQGLEEAFEQTVPVSGNESGGAPVGVEGHSSLAPAEVA